ncbi:MAG: Minf_1886 family protein [Candidatus Eisenbacteria bacterium]
MANEEPKAADGDEPIPDPIARLEQLSAAPGRFSVPAYLWIFRVLEHARRRLKRAGHITGQELLKASRELARAEFGPMALEVFRHWGFESASDIGRAVFDLVEAGILLKTENDSLGDFASAESFEEAFQLDFPW